MFHLSIINLLSRSIAGTLVRFLIYGNMILSSQIVQDRQRVKEKRGEKEREKADGNQERLMERKLMEKRTDGKAERCFPCMFFNIFLRFYFLHRQCSTLCFTR